jgi:hypothetical protein
MRKDAGGSRVPQGDHVLRPAGEAESGQARTSGAIRKGRVAGGYLLAVAVGLT